MAVTNNIVLDENVMEDVANKIQLQAEEIKNLLTNIEDEINAIGEVWQDNNSKEYLNKFQDLKMCFPTFYARAEASSRFIKGVVSAYRENVLNPTATAVRGTEINS